MDLVYMGAGFVGACSAAVSADSGHEVLAFDIDKDKIARLSSGDADVITSCLHEEGLADIIIQQAPRLTFSTDMDVLAAKLEKADAIFMCLPTPEKESGESDLTAFRKASETLGKLLVKRNNGEQTQRVVIINKSTVPIQTVDLTREILDKAGVRNFGVASNPEFLVEGQAIHDSIHPKRVVVGAECEEDLETLRGIYQRFYSSSNVQYIEMNPYEAASVKLLANTALFSRLAYTFSTVGRICELFPHLSYESIRRGVTSDTRIGKWGFYDSLYAGGSCLIKDAQSLSWQIQEQGGNADFINAILQSNTYQVEHFFNRAEEEANFDWNGKTVAILGLSFKQGTNDIRHSGALLLIKAMLGSGVASIQAFDPAASGMCASYFDVSKNDMYKKIVYKDSEVAALQDADCVILATDWPEFRTVGEAIEKNCQPPCLLMDGRRIIAPDYEKLADKGYTVLAVGSPLLGPSF